VKATGDNHLAATTGQSDVEWLVAEFNRQGVDSRPTRTRCSALRRGEAKIDSLDQETQINLPFITAARQAKHLDLKSPSSSRADRRPAERIVGPSNRPRRRRRGDRHVVLVADDRMRRPRRVKE